MNIIARLLSHDPFLERVARDIVGKSVGMTVPTAGGGEGRIEAFQLLGPPVFSGENCDCIGNTCSLPFSGQAKVVGRAGARNDGDAIPFAGEEEYSGHVDLSWPDGAHAETGADFSTIYPRIAIETVMDSITRGNAPPRTGQVPDAPAPQAAR